MSELDLDAKAKKIYRRKKTRLEWHYNPDCRRYPGENFELNAAGQEVLPTMVCHICKRLEAEKNGSSDTRSPKSSIRRLF